MQDTAEAHKIARVTGKWPMEKNMVSISLNSSKRQMYLGDTAF